jgi:hypothetical protein
MRNDVDPAIRVTGESAESHRRLNQSESVGVGLYLIHMLVFNVYDGLQFRFFPGVPSFKGHFSLMLIRFFICSPVAIALATTRPSCLRRIGPSNAENALQIATAKDPWRLENSRLGDHSAVLPTFSAALPLVVILSDVTRQPNAAEGPRV